MTVVLLVPPSTERSKCTPDLGLGYLASSVRAAGMDVHVIDSLLLGLDCEGVLTRLAAIKPNVVGIKTYSLDVGNVRQVIQRIREILPKTIIVVGGPHPTCEKASRLFDQMPGLDFAFRGEAESGFVLLLKRIASGSTDYSDVPGLVWRDEVGIVKTVPQGFEQDLDALPLPAWDLIDPRNYRFGYSFLTTQLPAAPMLMTRGCPYLCTFCGSYLITGRAVRTRSVDNIIEELKLLKDTYGVRTIDIVDENCAYDRDLLMAFCDRLIKEKIDIAWNCPYGVRLNCLDKELVQRMEQSGCFGVSVGIESGSDRILKKIKKGLTVEVIEKQIAMIRASCKMVVQGFFMMGFPEEKVEDVEKTIDLACRLPLDLAIFSVLWPTPGTEIYEKLLEDGKIAPNTDYAGVGHDFFVQSYCDLTDRQLRQLQRKAYQRFYLRPRIALNMVRLFNTSSQFRIVLDACRRLWRKPKVLQGKLP